MKTKPKQIIAISTGLVLIAGLLFWYFLPVFAGKWLIIKNPEFRHELSSRPSRVNKLPASPDDWDSISIDTLSLKLPMDRFSKIKFPDNSSFILTSDQGGIAINFDNMASFLPYEEDLAILNTIPDDISFFKPRNKNLVNSTNLILKVLRIPAHHDLTDVFTVNSLNLKAICIMNDVAGLGATINIYNKTENVFFTVNLLRYKNQDMLRSDILSILGSIKLPDAPLNSEQVKADIVSIGREYNLTIEE